MLYKYKLGLSKDSVIKNCFQCAGGHVHLGHDLAHHVGVGAVQIKKCTNSSRFLDLKSDGNSK